MEAKRFDVWEKYQVNFKTIYRIWQEIILQMQRGDPVSTKDLKTMLRTYIWQGNVKNNKKKFADCCNERKRKGWSSKFELLFLIMSQGVQLFVRS